MGLMDRDRAQGEEGPRAPEDKGAGLSQAIALWSATPQTCRSRLLLTLSCGPASGGVTAERTPGGEREARGPLFPGALASGSSDGDPEERRVQATVFLRWLSGPPTCLLSESSVSGSRTPPGRASQGR